MLFAVEKNKIRFELPGVPQAIRLSQEWDKNAEYKYFGRGLNEGECGVSIEHVKPTNNGKVKCLLGLAEDEVSGEIELTVACKYKFVYFSTSFKCLNFYLFRCCGCGNYIFSLHFFFFLAMH